MTLGQIWPVTNRLGECRHGAAIIGRLVTEVAERQPKFTGRRLAFGGRHQTFKRRGPVTFGKIKLGRKQNHRRIVGRESRRRRQGVGGAARRGGRGGKLLFQFRRRPLATRELAQFGQSQVHRGAVKSGTEVIGGQSLGRRPKFRRCRRILEPTSQQGLITPPSRGAPTGDEGEPNRAERQRQKRRR